MKQHVLLPLLGIVCLVGSQSAHAQGVTTSAIKGLVLDAKGEPLPGATVLAVHTPTGTKYGVSTRDNGQFDLLNLRIGGPYEITISFVGYETFVERNVQLALGKTYETRATLRDGAGQQLDEVMVRGNRDGQINPDRTGAATNIGSAAIRSLPTISRSQEDFTRLTPQASGNGLSFGGRNPLYNNFSLDGSIFNNSFGLDSPTPGGQTNSQPVSLDAIDQIQVSLAPYDVRQGGFSGAGVNAVTKSGTNSFKGTVYTYYRNENLIGRKVEGADIDNPSLKFNQTGFALGGPIIKNKLFFFVNGEFTRQTDPGQTFRPATSAAEAQAALSGQANGVSRVLQSDLDAIRQRLISSYGYDPGTYEGFNYRTYSDKILGKIDWNINSNNTFSVRYNYLRSYRQQGPHPIAIAPSSRVPGVNTLQFSNSGYTINNNLNSVVAELNSTFGNGKFSNKAQVSYSAFDDYRELPSGTFFPMIDITQGGTTYTSVGTEQFSANNTLNQHILQLTDNLSYFAGKHILTVGANYERFKFINGFNLQRYGYQRLELSDFLVSTVPGRAGFLDLNAQAAAGGRAPIKQADIDVAQLGVYVQDEFQLNPAFKLTLGVRADVPIYNTTVAPNPQIAAATFQTADGQPTRLDVTQFPKSTPLFSPRLGFNYNSQNSGPKTQLRGGTGIFTGRIPFVWISNQASNAQFSDGYTFQINTTGRDFKFPQVWRSNVAVDQELPGGIVATLEAIYTKDLNAVVHRNYNFVTPTQTLGGANGGDSRQIYPAAGPRLNSFVGPNGQFTFLDAGVIGLENVSQGYQYSFTGQLRKEFVNGFYLTAAYTYAQAKDVTSNPGEIAGDAYQRLPVVGNPNQPQLAYSDFGLQHRFIAAGGRRFSYANDHVATTLGFFFEAGQGNRFSYTYAGDLNRDGIDGNDLFFVPNAQNQINLVAYTNAAGQVVSAAQQWQQLDSYIAQDKYLSQHRGEYTERNGAISRWYTQFDFKVLQDFAITTSGGKKNTLQFSFDILNAGNLLNRNWGNRYLVGNNRLVQAAYPTTSPDTPAYTFNGGSQTFFTDTSLASRWRAQVGVRYIFD
ncbi:TonB-dependent receptor domain-containing protein [Hymenobacter sp. BT559]|uniref:TonB-dependent receptor n=1 Tax=Hymenobacter sp. BT559 TaxID=2795729 RepID=UPI0018EBB9C5|nr:TonB-dependent receptor [Hymenobacter sp. BT559]MBJ6142263.1 carboxypeptidase regulatory-like domain-containing protein [Hymenobacter sp. BT559]